MAFTSIKINSLVHTNDTNDPIWYDNTDQTSPYSQTDELSSSYSRFSSRSSSTSTQLPSEFPEEPLTPPESTGALNPPTVINISDLEPLRLAKKKHYSPVSTSSFRIQKKLPVKASQGRPFNETLNARFICFNSIDDLIANLLNICDHDSIRLMKQFPIITDSDQTNEKKSHKNLISGIIEHSKELSLKKIDDTSFQVQAIEFDKLRDNYLNIHDELCETFNLKQFSFVKIIRNNKGRLVKFEILSKIDKTDIDINFIKKFITYPRYKSKMKIFLINTIFEQDVWFYNDLRMLLWDIENGQVSHKKILINNRILAL